MKEGGHLQENFEPLPVKIEPGLDAEAKFGKGSGLIYGFCSDHEPRSDIEVHQGIRQWPFVKPVQVRLNEVVSVGRQEAAVGRLSGPVHFACCPRRLANLYPEIDGAGRSLGEGYWGNEQPEDDAGEQDLGDGQRAAAGEEAVQSTTPSSRGHVEGRRACPL